MKAIDLILNRIIELEAEKIKYANDKTGLIVVEGFLNELKTIACKSLGMDENSLEQLLSTMK